ncbi:hypothetical protein OBBRIDRAFT_808274 [Obba rivulosa]|uniref:DUF6589 domain-containing protein n=1 Tax=Obba rivulosa TaxID=1052685 RepID=A0A8E2AM61_9APHY|nr:hypothetical protein OBBRIDRAFT_808274 [Obba rivulosa]
MPNDARPVNIIQHNRQTEQASEFKGAGEKTKFRLICLGARSQKNSYTQQVLGFSYPMIVGRTYVEDELEVEVDKMEDKAEDDDDETEALSEDTLSDYQQELTKESSDMEAIKDADKKWGHIKAISLEELNVKWEPLEDLKGGQHHSVASTSVKHKPKQPEAPSDNIQSIPSEVASLSSSDTWDYFGTYRMHVLVLSAISTNALMSSFVNAPPLSHDDVLLSTAESNELHACLVHTVLHIIVEYGGEGFSRFRADVKEIRLDMANKIPVHKTEIYPLLAMHIDESSTIGNAKVVKTIFHELGQDIDSSGFTNHVKIIEGDQLSIASTMPGLFYYKMAATHRVMELFYGSSNTTRNSGSLTFHNTILDRKPIVLSSLLPFLFQFANLKVVAKLHNAHEAEKRSKEHHDARQSGSSESTSAETYFNLTEDNMLLENGILFLHSTLVLHEFNDTIKFWTFGFRGSGRTKYAQEVLHFIHNITHVWPKDLQDVVLKNWLVNPSGYENLWVEIDLMQEHLNFWIKNIYKAYGSSASWEWLSIVSPCVDILRQLAMQMNTTLEARQGSKHTSPDLEKNIQELMHSIHEHHIYEIVPSRTFDVNKPVALNTITIRLSHLYVKLLVGDSYLGADHTVNTAMTEPEQLHYQLGIENTLQAQLISVLVDEDSSDLDSEDESIVDENEGLVFSLDGAEDVALDMDAIKSLFLSWITYLIFA